MARSGLVTPPMLMLIIMRVRDGLDEDAEGIERTQPKLPYADLEEAVDILATKVEELESRGVITPLVLPAQCPSVLQRFRNLFRSRKDPNVV